MSAGTVYPPHVWELFQGAPGAGRPEAETQWVSAEASDPLTKTCVRFFVRVLNGRIEGLQYQVRGCPYTVAAAAWTARCWLGQVVGEARVDPRRLLNELEAPVTKLGRLLVVEEAFRKSLLATAMKP